MTSSVFLAEGIFVPGTFKLILNNDNYAVSSNKDWPTSTEGLLSLPHQSQKSTAHLSEMLLLGHEILMWQEYVSLHSSGLVPREVVIHSLQSVQ